MKILLARHAETLWNEQLRYIGRTDLSLSRLGMKNARLFADHLAGEEIDAIHSSPMRRAMETAGWVASSRDLGIHGEPLLREIDFGCWEGLTHTEIEAAYPELLANWLADPFSADIPEGEPVRIFAERVWRGWRKLLDRLAAGDHRTVLLVTHAGCIKIILGRILGRPKSEWWKIYQDKGALNVLELDEFGASVKKINDSAYRNGKDSARL